MKLLNDLLRKIIKNYKFFSLFIFIFYAVGFAGFVIPVTTPLFQELIPYSIILSFLVILIFDNEKNYKAKYLAFLVIYIFSFVIEAIGVNYKFIFGDYTYGESLGIKIFSTPLIIGINWLFITYLSSSIFENIKINVVWKIFLSSITMVIYDLVLEGAAPKLNMWYWENNSVPLKNYIAWFILAFVFNTIIKLFNISTKNKIAPILLLTQFVFFSLLNMYL